MIPPKVKSRKNPVKPEQFLADAEISGNTCTICSSPISQGETVVKCPFCKLPFHAECWAEIGGCGNYGCAAVPDLPKAEYKGADQFQEGWAMSKKCPVCRQTIIASALKCKFCRADFPHERPMTPEEYENREYQGNELARARNMSVLNFILSVTGCLFFISVPHNLVLLLSSEGTLFNPKRLPGSLKVLFYASCVISMLWIVIGLVLFLIF